MARQMIRSKFLWWVVGVILAIAIFFLAAVFWGWYPIAIVDSHIIWARDYHNNYALAYHYYDATNEMSEDIVDPSDLENMLRSAALQSLIDRVFVVKKLRDDFSSKDLSSKISERINQVWSDEDLRRDLRLVLQVSDNVIQDDFIAEQVRYELLSGQLSLEGQQDVLSWIRAQRAQAQVRIFLKNFTWSPDGITI